MSIDPNDRREEREIKIMAMQIADQAMLDKLLEGSDPAMRKAMIEKLTPYLGFEPDAASEDCPHCGRRNGLVIAHECLGIN